MGVRDRLDRIAAWFGFGVDEDDSLLGHEHRGGAASVALDLAPAPVALDEHPHEMEPEPLGRNRFLEPVEGIGDDPQRVEDPERAVFEDVAQAALAVEQT